MSYLTEREKEILQLLKQEMSVRQIGEKYGISMTSVSRSITSIRRKSQDIEEDVSFLKEIGFLTITGDKLSFISPSRDPKALGKAKERV